LKFELLFIQLASPGLLHVYPTYNNILQNWVRANGIKLQLGAGMQVMESRKLQVRSRNDQGYQCTLVTQWHAHIYTLCT